MQVYSWVAGLNCQVAGLVAGLNGRIVVVAVDTEQGCLHDDEPGGIALNCDAMRCDRGSVMPGSAAKHRTLFNSADSIWQLTHARRWRSAIPSLSEGFSSASRCQILLLTSRSTQTTVICRSRTKGRMCLAKMKLSISS